MTKKSLWGCIFSKGTVCMLKTLNMNVTVLYRSLFGETMAEWIVSASWV